MNTYRVTFRRSTVVDDLLIRAKTMTKAAKKAARETRRTGGAFDGWTVYAITLL